MGKSISNDPNIQIHNYLVYVRAIANLRSHHYSSGIIKDEAIAIEQQSCLPFLNAIAV
ncbi:MULTISPECIES: hypothetical protein [Spirulina sp. CCY15215]|uniref:hypothetical protein n=1 Tax=Spirulina sp. CCY15215 TaxID=2767591 RepID=UPI0019507399|nr:hypothetical protein [Spirulina major]